MSDTFWDNMQRFFIIFGVFCAVGVSIVNSEELKEVYDSGQPYCFKFTWLGPKSEEIDDLRNGCVNITGPCFQPLVVSNDSTLPNLDYMWKTMNKSEIGCNMRQGYVCIKYTYSYNNAVLNISHFCGKMTENNASPIVDGCYEQKVNGHIIEACACTSEPGGIPCNSSGIIHASIISFIVIFYIINLIQ